MLFNILVAGWTSARWPYRTWVSFRNGPSPFCQHPSVVGNQAGPGRRVKLKSPRARAFQAATRLLPDRPGGAISSGRAARTRLPSQTASLTAALTWLAFDESGRFFRRARRHRLHAADGAGAAHGRDILNRRFGVQALLEDDGSSGKELLDDLGVRLKQRRQVAFHLRDRAAAIDFAIEHDAIKLG